jgi:glycosyltransferase involved in cell wall biosynthesis
MHTPTRSNPNISVVIPVHNKEPHLRRCINSVLGQTFMDWELLLVDDASTDGSCQLINEYRLKDSRVRTLKRGEPGPGGYAARNLGVAEASGKWIAFLDADDYWNPGHLEALMNQVSLRTSYVVVCAPHFEQNGQLLHLSRFFQKQLLKGKGSKITLNAYLRMLTRNNPAIWTGAVAVKREEFLSIGGFPESIAKKGGDIVVWLKLLQSYSVWLTHVPTSVYVRGTVNAVTSDHAIWPRYLLEMTKRQSQTADSVALRKAFMAYNRKLGRTWILRNGSVEIADYLVIPTTAKRMLKHLSPAISRLYCRFRSSNSNNS